MYYNKTVQALNNDVVLNVAAGFIKCFFHSFEPLGIIKSSCYLIDLILEREGQLWQIAIESSVKSSWSRANNFPVPVISRKSWSSKMIILDSLSRSDCDKARSRRTGTVLLEGLKWEEEWLQLTTSLISFDSEQLLIRGRDSPKPTKALGLSKLR